MNITTDFNIFVNVFLDLRSILTWFPVRRKISAVGIFFIRIGTAILIILAAITLSAAASDAQDMVDMTIATVSDGLSVELITLSDLRWQLALQPDKQLDPPQKDDLEQALQTVIDQRIFSIESKRFPRPAPTDAEIKEEIDRLLAFFPSAADFEKRLRMVGFESIRDDNFQRLIAERVAINKYVDFRFRAFVVITPDEITRYFNDIFLPDFKRKYPGVVLPTLDEKREAIRSILIEEHIASRIESFLDDAKRRVEIEMLTDL